VEGLIRQVDVVELSTGGVPDEVDTWVLRIPGTDEFGGLELSALDTVEHQRMASFLRETDRRRYGFAHLALRTVLGAKLGVAPRTLEFARESCPSCGGPHGRPVLGQKPVSVEFSLSHGGELVVIGLSVEAIGVDVEPVPEDTTAAELTPLLHPAEQASIEAESQSAAFTRLWARKEAYLKGLGTGLGRDLAADDVSNPIPGWSIADLPVPSGYAAALAVRSMALRAIRLYTSLPSASGLQD
jgi:4'-phosphopantetheinyl transferase